MESIGAPDSTEYSLIADLTSPSQLQEVTLDQDGTFSNALGIKSPNGPMRGRSVKEFEEQLTSLKKENFNLKLRIYFLEEKLGTGFTLDKDNVLKKNIDLQVQIATLQNEVEEKHNLLVEAVKAMELNDEEHKKYAQHKEEQLAQLQQEMEELRMHLHMQLDSENSASDQMLMEQVENLQKKCESAQEEMQEKDEQIKTMNEKIDLLNQTLTDLSLQMGEYKGKLTKIRQENESLVKQVNSEHKKAEEISEQYNELKKKYSMAKCNLDISARAKAVNDIKINKMERELERYKSKVKELQMELEKSSAECRKQQLIAVSKSLEQSSKTTDTDPHLISVADPATCVGAEEKDELHVPIDSPAQSIGKHIKGSGENAEISSEFEIIKADNNSLKQKIIKLKGEQMKACEIIRSMIESRNKANEEINQLRKTNQELEKELENVVSKPTKEKSDDTATNQGIVNFAAVSTPPCEAEKEKQVLGHKINMTSCYQELVDELEAKSEILMATVREKDSQMQSIKTKYDNLLQIVQEKENQIIDLEFELLTSNQDNTKDKSVEKVTTHFENNISFYEQELQLKDKEIERLNSEIKKSTHYLQEIVNKELWEKNKEIEKLHKKNELIKRELIEADYQHSLLNNSHEKSLIDQLTTVKVEKRHLEDRILTLELQVNQKDERERHLVAENDSLKAEIEKSDKLRTGTTEICRIVTKRLEGLATFLDFLLKQNSVLGFLGPNNLDSYKKLKDIIDNSLNLSKSFITNMSFIPDKSLAQLTDISTLLNDTRPDLTFSDEDIDKDEEESLAIISSCVSLTYQNRLHKHKGNQTDRESVIMSLRKQITNLENELQLRDMEINRLHTQETQDEANVNLGSEEMFHSDQKVSVQGLNFKKMSEINKQLLKSMSTPIVQTSMKCHTDLQSDSESWSEPDTNVSRARVGLNTTYPFYKSIPLSADSTEEEQNRLGLMKRGKKTISQQQNNIFKLKEGIIKPDMAIQQNTNVVSTTSAKCKNGNVATDTENDVEQRLEWVQVECERYKRLSDEKEEEINILKDKLKDLESEMSTMEENLRKEYEECTIKKLKLVEDEFISRVKSVMQKSETEVKAAQEALNELKRDYSQNYIKKSDVECKLAEVETLKMQLYELKDIVKSYEESVDSYKRKEDILRGELIEYQQKYDIVRKELDTKAEEYSQVLLEKTNLANKNSKLEEELATLCKKETELRKDLSQIQSELSEVTQSYRDQHTNLQAQKAQLEIKIAELESRNNELYNKLVQSQINLNTCNITLPNIGSRNIPLRPYRRNCSDQNCNSEDNLNEIASIQGQLQDSERGEGNSSPDLGIESDQGRFSSLETHLHGSRPLMHTIELTESMNNLLDRENNHPETVDCGTPHCCEKTLEIRHENADLKKKLHKMKKALEETANQLNLANQRKKQVEKSICKQIHKTSQVLRKAKANLDSGSESDVLKM